MQNRGVCVSVCVCVRARMSSSIRVHVRADAEFTRENVDQHQMRIMGYFASMPQDVMSAQDVDLTDIVSDLANQVENFNSRGSGFTIDRIIKFVLCITKYRPIHGGTYIETPDHIKRESCVVNIRNFDSKCFVYSVLSTLYPPKHHAERVSHYTNLESNLNLTGLTFPLHPKHIPVFERLNPSISVNVFSLGEQINEICVEYRTLEKGRKHHVNLLLLSNETGQRHYVRITDMSRLIAARTAHNGRSHICYSCLHVFSEAHALKQHEPQCMQHPPSGALSESQ